MTGIGLLFRYLGYVFVLVALYHLSIQCIDPYSTIGPFFYLIMGCLIILSTYKVKLSPYVHQILYEKSFLDFYFGPPSTEQEISVYNMIQVVPLFLFASIIIPQEDIKRLIKQLPSQVRFLAQKGMIHSLPESIKTLIQRHTYHHHHNQNIGFNLNTRKFLNNKFNEDIQLTATTSNSGINSESETVPQLERTEEDFLNLVWIEINKQVNSSFMKLRKSVMDILFYAASGGNYSENTLIGYGTVGILISTGLNQINQYTNGVWIQSFIKSTSYVIAFIGYAATFAFVTREAQKDRKLLYIEYFITQKIKALYILLFVIFTVEFQIRFKLNNSTTVVHRLEWLRKLILGRFVLSPSSSQIY